MARYINWDGYDDQDDDDSDDGYDMDRDAYNMGHGSAVSWRQRQEEQDEIDEYRRNNRY